MMSAQNNGNIPQVGRELAPQSHPVHSGCPMDSGEGKQTSSLKAPVVGDQATMLMNATGRQEMEYGENGILKRTTSPDETADRSRKGKISQCVKCGANVTVSNLVRHQKSKKCINASNPSDNQTLNVSSKQTSCEKCGKQILVSNLARHQKSQSCHSPVAKILSNEDAKQVKVKCEKCGVNVTSSNLARHLKSKKCNNASKSSVPQTLNDSTKQKSCQKCGKQILASNLSRHQKSQSCQSSDAKTLNEETKQVKVQCVKCGANVRASNLARHLKSKKCINMSNHSNQPSVANEEPKPVEGANTEQRELDIEQGCQREDTHMKVKENDMVYSEQRDCKRENTNMNIKPAPENKICWSCQEPEMLAQWKQRIIPTNEKYIRFCKVCKTGVNEKKGWSRQVQRAESTTPIIKEQEEHENVKPPKDINNDDVENEQNHESSGRDNHDNSLNECNQSVSASNSEPEKTYQNNVQEERQGDKSEHDSTTDKLLDVQQKETAFKNRLKTFVINNTGMTKDPKVFLRMCKPLVIEKIKECIEESNLKVNLMFHAEFQRVANEKEIIQLMNFKTTNKIIYPTSTLSEYYSQAQEKILAEVEGFQASGSNWTLRKTIDLEIRVNKYIPLRGSSYIDLPIKIKHKKAVINVQNNDQKCFLWSILAALHPAKGHVDRVSSYKPYEHEYKEVFKNIEFPVKLDDITKFEKLANISINVYTLTGQNHSVVPLRITNEEMGKHIDLLYLKSEKTDHYCYIKNLSRLVSSQISGDGHKMWLCKRCLLHFSTEERLIKHQEDCSRYEGMKVDLPQPGSVIKFEDFNKSMRVPFVIYADFECLLEPNRSRKTEKTQSYQKHLPMSFAYYIVTDHGDYKPPVTYFGPDAGKVFVEQLEMESEKIGLLYSKESIKPMELTFDDNYIISHSETCHICEKPLNNDRVLDHDHLTGKFRGVAHSKCNIQYRKPKFIPIFIHNLSGYDTHLFIKMLGMNDEEITVIPNNEERYISYSVKRPNMIELRFLDSFKFMSSSLDALTKNLQRDQFNHTAKYFNGSGLDLLLRKGIYPYDYMDSEEKYEQTHLPKYEEFYNELSKTDIEDTDYDHAERVWEFFKIKNMKEYTLLYNKSDVLLLADVMENFRDVCMSTYKLDPAWFFTTPGLAWSAMLKTTQIELELITDYDMLLMIEKGIRGGVSQSSNRYAKANNPYMKDYDPSKPTEYLMYLDANNLYGWAMLQHMPYKDFKWCETNLDVTKIPDDGDTGYILEVDLEYPHELHDLHSDLPLAPEQRLPPGGKVKKLLTTLYDKERYVVHYRNLKLYLKLGMKIKKVHRAISFSQMNWIAPYIELNTKLRTQARNEFEKDFYKLMNNGVFGKTMENIRNRVDIRLATKEKQVVKWIALPTFKDRTIFAENLSAIHMRRTKLLFNKPIYVGMSVLDISKTLIYDFHYNVIKAKYGDKARLQYTDTDSLKYMITTPDFYQDMKTMIDYFDTSDYPEDNPYGLPRVNKKVLGKMKDELKGKIMREQVALRSKMYAHEVEDGSVCKKSKGVKKSVTENEISFSDYKRCLFEGIEKKKDVKITKTINMIRSYNHDLYTVALDKTVLSNQDDKRFILKDGIRSLPWGHHAISEGEAENSSHT